HPGTELVLVDASHHTYCRSHVMKNPSKAMIAVLACAASIGLARSAPAQAPPQDGPEAGGPRPREATSGHADPAKGDAERADLLAMLAGAVNLSADQQAQIKAIIEATHSQMH